MKRAFAVFLTLIMLVLMLAMGLSRPVAPRAPDVAITSVNAPLDDDGGFANSRFPGAAERIDRLIATARTGDVAAYLDAYGGTLRVRLEQEAQELGWAAFAGRLRQAGEARKSHAIFAAEPDGSGRDAARITVETTYADRLERRTYRLERSAGRWLVTDVETAHEFVPKNPLGSLATYQEPEAVPVDADFPR
jgi:hypothetical protein